MLTQWFDIASLENPSYRNHTQLPGLEESYLEVLHLINKESNHVPQKNIILGGLSQGFVMALMTLLTLPFPLGGFIGMSGWLPFQEEIEDAAQAGEGGNQETPDTCDDDSPFDDDGCSSSEDLGAAEPIVRVMKLTRDLITLDASDIILSKEASAIPTPVFLAHGDADTKVKPALGEAAYKTLISAGFHVIWKIYEDQGHWYKIPDQIDDIYEFINR